MKKIFFFSVLLALLGSCVSQSKYNRDIEDLEYRISCLEEEKEELEGEKEELEEQVETLEDIIERAKRMCLLWDDDTFMVLNVLNEY